MPAQSFRAFDCRCGYLPSPDRASIVCRERDEITEELEDMTQTLVGEHRDLSHGAQIGLHVVAVLSRLLLESLAAGLFEEHRPDGQVADEPSTSDHRGDRVNGTVPRAITGATA
jgi:hypothetical protein